MMASLHSVLLPPGASNHGEGVASRKRKRPSGQIPIDRFLFRQQRANVVSASTVVIKDEPGAPPYQPEPAAGPNRRCPLSNTSARRHRFLNMYHQHSESASKCVNCHEPRPCADRCDLVPEEIRKSRPQCPYFDCGLSPRNVSRHFQTVHRGAKPFACARCPKKFTSKANLEAHLSAHKREWPFACDVCQRRFRRASALAGHRRMLHEPNAPRVRCPECPNRSFKTSSGLSRHMRKVHTGHAPYHCEACDLRYETLVRYSEHRVQYHQEAPADSDDEQSDVKSEPKEYYLEFECN